MSDTLTLIWTSKNRRIHGPGDGQYVSPFVPFGAPKDWAFSRRGTAWRRLVELSQFRSKVKRVGEASIRQLARNAGVDAEGELEDVRKRLLKMCNKKPVPYSPPSPARGYQLAGDEGEEGEGPFSDLSWPELQGLVSALRDRVDSDPEGNGKEPYLIFVRDHEEEATAILEEGAGDEGEEGEGEGEES